MSDVNVVADAGAPEEQNEPETDTSFIPHRVFLNQLDEYNGRHIAEYLTDQLQGALRGARDEEQGEGGPEEEEPEEAKAPVKPEEHTTSHKYEIIGTKKNAFGVKTEDVLETISEQDPENLIKEIIKCGFVVYDISKDVGEAQKALAVLTALENEILQVKEIGPKTFKRFDRIFVFILITSVLSWAKTKPIDRDDPDVPFNEADYKKRKPHPNFLEQIACEREVILKGKKYKDNLKTYVICTGITYGYEEDELMFYFKMTWRNEKYLPLLLPGNNTIPLIHVRDLAQIIHTIMELVPNKPNYILAVEQTPCKQKQFIKALGKAMGRAGRMKEVGKDEAFLYNDMTQNLYDRYTLNLKMEPAFVVDTLGIMYKSDLNLAENMKAIVAEFKEWRSLEPKRILLHGPPASGKTILAKRLAEYYGVHYISVKTLIEEIIEDLKETIDLEIAKKNEKKANAPKDAGDDEEEAGEEGEEEEEINTEELWEKLRDIETTMERSDHGKLPDEQVIRLLRTYLATNICQNQGYVLDGYPKTMDQVKELFGMESEKDEEGGGGGEEDDEPTAGKVSIMPAYVISLEATDEFLFERVMNLPEKDVQGTHYTEEHMLRRIREFRLWNTEDNTMLNFFDENEIHPLIINIEDELFPDMESIFLEVKSHLGPAIGFEMSKEEKEDQSRCNEAAQKLQAEQKQIQQKLLEEEALEEYQLKMEEKIRILEYLQMEEEKLLTTQCEPLRSYLMKYVFPTLTEGLLEVARIKPRDPVDYLAEFLFKMNPEGKMFDPAYTRHGERINRMVTRLSK